MKATAGLAERVAAHPTPKREPVTRCYLAALRERTRSRKPTSTDRAHADDEEGRKVWELSTR